MWNDPIWAGLALQPGRWRATIIDGDEITWMVPAAGHRGWRRFASVAQLGELVLASCLLTTMGFAHQPDIPDHERRPSRRPQAQARFARACG